MNDMPFDVFHAPTRPLGKHLIAEFHGARNLYDPAPCEAVLSWAAAAAGATLLRTFAHDFGEREGFTAVAVLAESHISLHTWPEHGYLALDVFMCGDAEPERALAVLKDYFQPEAIVTQTLSRGLTATSPTPVRARATA